MANKKNTNQQNKFLDILYNEFGSESILDNIYKIAVCKYLDDTEDCILIGKVNKNYEKSWRWGKDLYHIKSNTGISLESIIRMFNFDHIILEPKHFYKQRQHGCNNCKYIK
jgi:hypothetical protein